MSNLFNRSMSLKQIVRKYQDSFLYTQTTRDSPLTFKRFDAAVKMASPQSSGKPLSQRGQLKECRPEF